MTTLTKNTNGRTPAQRWNNPFDRFFRNDFMDMWPSGVSETVPSINIAEGKDQYSIEMAAPGLKKEDFNIDVDGNLITISCEKESETKEGKEGDNYSRREYNYSSFSRSFTIPENANAENISARYNDGILKLTVPKKPQSQKGNGQKIKVE
jgi:HSP20 family protein